MFRGMTSIIYKETIHIIRDPRTLFLMLVVPAIQLTIFGYAIELDVKNIPTVVYNLDGRTESKQLIQEFVNTGYFDVVGPVFSDEELQGALVRGEARVGIKIPPNYTDRIRAGKPAQIQVLIDGSDSTVAMQALNVANGITLRRSLLMLNEGLESRAPLIDTRPRMLFNPAMRTANFMVPGLIGIVLQIVTMILTAFAIVREKENGTLEQLMVTPVSRLGLMCGKIAPYGFVGILETIMVILIMRFVFQVPIAGNLFLLAGFALIFLFTSLGIGLLISTVAENQVQAIQLAFIVMLPSVLLSGFIFPIESMPAPIQVLSAVLPVTYFVQILRGIILRDAAFADLWVQGFWLVVIGLLLLAISARRFRKTIA